MEKRRHARRDDSRQGAIMRGQTLKKEAPFKRVTQQGWRHIRALESNRAKNDGVGRDREGQMKARRKIEDDTV
ncbi:hypothetical protein AA0323_1150 [Asaia siamensis NRIC 0323]|nr:hypothetical protein AA0323_1150 [Asaia siamensis NRIC 0323]